MPRDPELKPGEVLVRVRAVGLNPPDWYLRDGYKMLPPEWQPHVAFPLILGTDISGVVDSVGDDVKTFTPRRRGVFDGPVPQPASPAGSRAYAEYVAVPASELAHKPAGIDHVMLPARRCRCSPRGSS